MEKKYANFPPKMHKNKFIIKQSQLLQLKIILIGCGFSKKKAILVILHGFKLNDGWKIVFTNTYYLFPNQVSELQPCVEKQSSNSSRVWHQNKFIASKMFSKKKKKIHSQ